MSVWNQGLARYLPGSLTRQPAAKPPVLLAFKGLNAHYFKQLLRDFPQQIDKG
jgi:hypothetical protein